MTENVDLRPVLAFVDEMAKVGVAHVVLSPGSRNAPLTIACARQAQLRLYNVLDERSAAYFALGLARASKTAVALVCTSGTATANYLPAVIEAHYSGVPLLVITADRPPELYGVGGNQTIVQSQLYGPYVKSAWSMPVAQDTPTLMIHARVTAARAVALAQAAVPGPVHINWPLREPLIPPGADGPAIDSEPAKEPADEFLALRPLVRIYGETRGAPLAARQIARDVAHVTRGLILCGPTDDVAVADAALRLSERLGWPILADGLSQIRLHKGVHTGVIAHYDTVLRGLSRARRVQWRPDVIVRVGAPPTSKVLGECLALWNESRQIVVDEWPAYRDPARSATDVVQADPATFLREWLSELPADDDAPRGWGSYARLWQMADGLMAEEQAERLYTDDRLVEGAIIGTLAHCLPEESTLFVGNSMPVRDLDSFLPRLGKSVRIVSNRGASGIDGVLSCALGAAAVNQGPVPVTLVIGDLSFLHDIGGLLVAADYELALVIVVVDNDGGGIFSYLPQASQADVWPHFATPHGVDLRHAAALYRGRVVPVPGVDHLSSALAEAWAAPGWSLLVVKSQRDESLQGHQALWGACARRLDEALAESVDKALTEALAGQGGG